MDPAKRKVVVKRGEGHMATWQDVTLLIITKEEAANITGCVRSAGDVGHVLVVDSGSADGTQSLARELGAEVIVHPFTGYADQYNWGFDRVRTPYLMWLDADERISREGLAELKHVLEGNPDVVEVPRLSYFMGRWIRHSGWYPDFTPRLWRTGVCRFEDRAVHARVMVPSEMVRVRASQPLYHFSYRDVAHWVEKINRYTSLEVENRQMSHDAVRRTWSQLDRKQKWKYRLRNMPGRSLGRFLWMYVIHRGFLDGRQGFFLAVLSSFYEYLAAVKVWETRNDADAVNFLRQRDLFDGDLGHADERTKKGGYI